MWMAEVTYKGFSFHLDELVRGEATKENGIESSSGYCFLDKTRDLLFSFPRRCMAQSFKKRIKKLGLPEVVTITSWKE